MHAGESGAEMALDMFMMGGVGRCCWEVLGGVWGGVGRCKEVLGGVGRCWEVLGGVGGVVLGGVGGVGLGGVGRCYLRLLLQELSKGQRIGALLADAEREGLDAALEQEAGVGVQAAPQAAMQLQDLHIITV